jgi:hypothetical protein
MNKFYLLCCFLFLSASAMAQTKKLPVQGKLFENNLPVTGSRNLSFSIASISWSQTLNNVQVSEGLYAVELDVPADLFATQASHDLSISVNGTPLTTVKIHPPIESDPTVPASLKDGVSWNEVTDKPATIDLDTTNELQTLSLAGTTLSISGGNEVVLPAGGGGGGNGVFDTIVVGPAKLDTVYAAAATQAGISNNSPSDKVTQVFVSEITGRLIAIEVECSNLDGLSSSMRIFEGKAIIGQPIGSNSYTPSAFGASTAFNVFNPQQPDVILEKNKAYIFEIAISNGNFIFKTRSNDAYPYGASNLGPGIDLNFRIVVEATVGPNFTVNEDGNVGIGTDNPTSKLTVNGRIEDETGFVMPVGSIIPWAGPAPNPPKGWLVCDGSEVSKAVYSDLFQVIGTSWGAGTGPDSTEKFRIPDLRGQFLRGWSGDADYDPNKNSRHIINDIQKVLGNVVGSYQNDALQFHSHRIPRTSNNPGANGFWGGGSGDNGAPYVNAFDITTQSGQSSPRTASETRPRNAAVLYIIKY